MSTKRTTKTSLKATNITTMEDESTSNPLPGATSDTIMTSSTATMIDTAALLSGITMQFNHLRSEWKQDIDTKFNEMATKIAAFNTTLSVNYSS
jgi:hypothetical protein